MEVVELDPCISEIAKTWFEFKEDERMKIIIEDGLKYIETKGLCSAFFAFKIHVRSFYLHFSLFLYFCFVVQWLTGELWKDFKQMCAVFLPFNEDKHVNCFSLALFQKVTMVMM